MADTIYRQAAIDALDEIESEVADGYGYQYEKWRKYFCGLPSAQPEIIRCKECLMHGVCRFEQGLGLDGYCSQAERRTDENNND